MHVAYFVHDLTDPAVAKRVRMLTGGGATVTLLGFRRDDKAITGLAGVRIVDLGRTYDRNFLQRVLMVARQRRDLGSWAESVRDADVLLARNLETLALAAGARRRFAPRARLAYESLDIHRLLLSAGVAGMALRAIEWFLLRGADLLVTSSPAFVSEYFEPRQGVTSRLRIPVLLVENKILLEATAAMEPAAPDLPPGPPWRVGWFGMIRCHKSLDELCALAVRRPNLLQLTIRGRPSYVEFADFDGQIARTPNVSFGGPYQAAELGRLYGDVHFNWAIDFFEEGANSSWLLPNRIYEGGFHNAVPIALAGTETGRFLKRLGLGVTLDTTGAELEAFLEQLTPARYAALKEASRAAPRSAFVAEQRDFTRLLDALGNLPPVAEGAGPVAGLSKA